MSPVIQGLVNDSAAGEDSLAIARDSRILSHLILSRLIEPPLSIGVFGEHGTGRSFFLHLLQRDLVAHADESDLNIVNVSFDALLNVETNPWIALVDAIYRALEADVINRTGSLSPLERDRLFEGLGGTADRLRTREMARVDQAAVAYRKAIKSYRSARSKHRRNLARLANAVSWQRWQVIEQEYWKKQISGEEATIDVNGRRIGVVELSKKPEDLHNLLNQAKTIEGIASIISTSITATPMLGTLALIFLVVLLAAGLGGIALLLKDTFPEVKDLLDAYGKTLSIAGTVTGAFGVLALVFMRNRARYALNRLRRFVDNLRNAERSADSDHSLEEALIEENVVVSRDVLANKRGHMQESKNAYLSARQAYRKFLEPGILRRVIEFYRGTLVSDAMLGAGIVPVLREDIEALTQWLSLEQTSSRSVGAAEVSAWRSSRIVVYIDDFDRCPPEHVFNIMQATNLLLSTPLFVVIMIMDPIMTLRALEPTYRSLLRDSDLPGQTNQAGISAIDYLGRMVQIPFWLYKPSYEQIDAFVEAILQPFGMWAAEGPEVEGSALDSEAPIVRAEAALDFKEAPELAPLDVDNIFTPQDMEIVRRIILVAPVTPRTVKRFVNLCRLAIAEIRADDGYEETDFDAVAALLAIVVGFPLEAPQIFQLIHQDPLTDLRELVDQIGSNFEIPPTARSAIGEILNVYGQGADTREAVEKLRQVRWLAARHSFNVPPTMKNQDRFT